MKKLVCVLAVLVCFSSCSSTEVEETQKQTQTQTEATVQTTETTKVTSVMETTVLEMETTPAPIIIDGEKYDSDKDFLLFNNKGMSIKIASYKAARAWLRNDKAELKSYLIERENDGLPEDFNYPSDDMSNRYDELKYMSLSYVHIISENEVEVGYILSTESWETLLYLDMELVKTEDEWKVKYIYLQP